MNWQEAKQNMKNEIMENKPIAKVDDLGNITLELPDSFYNSLEHFCNQGKAEIKKRAFQISMLTALGIGGAMVAIGNDPQITSNILGAAHAYTLGAGFYILNAYSKKKEAEYYYNHLEENFKKEAQERYENNEYYTIRDDGTIEFEPTINEDETYQPKTK